MCSVKTAFKENQFAQSHFGRTGISAEIVHLQLYPLLAHNGSKEVPQVPRRSHRYPGVCPTSLGGPSTALRKLTAVSEFLPSAECVRGGGGGVSPSVGAGVNAGRRQRRPAPLPARPFRTQGARNTVVFNSPGNNHNLSIFWPRS